MTNRARRASDFLRNRLGADLADLGAEIGGLVGASAARLALLLERAGDLVDDLAADSAAVAREAERLREVVIGRSASARDALRAAPRFARIVREALLLVAAYRLHRAARRPGSDLLGDAAVAAARERLDREGARRIRRLCEDLRGGVLKLGQLASTRPDLLPPPYVDELGKLQDRVPPAPPAQIAASIEESLGAALDARFAAFSTDPIAAASLSQVHAARLLDGAPVAVKVLVPGIEEIVEGDLAALRVVAPALREAWPRLDVEPFAQELTRSLRIELDLDAEAANAERFASESARDEGVIVPRVHHELSSRRLLVLERIEGKRLPDWLDACNERGDAGRADRDRLLSILVRTTSAQILARGFFHGDPHPGNFLVVDGESGPLLAILDFGCVQEIAPEGRRAWAQLVLAGVSRDVARAIALLEDLGFESRGGADDLRRFSAKLLDAVGPGGPLTTRAEDASARLRALLELLSEGPAVRVPADAVLLGRVIASLGGLIARHRPGIDLLGLVLPDLLRAAAEPVDLGSPVAPPV